MACFVKRMQRYTEFPFPPNVLKNYFSKNLKISQRLDTNQSKQHPKHLYHSPGSHKNKNSTYKAIKQEITPLNAKSKIREVSILAKTTNTYNRTKLYINATKAGAPCFKIIVGLLVIPP